MMLRTALLSGTAWLTIAAAPPSAFTTMPLLPPIVTVKPQKLPDPATPSGFAPAPLPNRDALAPVTRASRDASLSAGIFTRRDQYRGEGLNAANSAQTQEDRHVQPGGGVNLTMPLQ